MIRLLAIAFAALIVWRALSGLLQGIGRGLRGEMPGGGARRSGVPARGVQMVRDPQCGTFLVPTRGVSADIRGARHIFCSAACRDAFAAGVPAPATGRPSA